MGKILDFFKGQKPEQPRSAPFEELLERVRRHFRPAIRLRKIADDSSSYFGGSPRLPKTQAWPEKDGRSLSFLACIDLSSVSKLQLTPWLPSSGYLFFFYDIEEQPWGFDPKDRGSWAVIYSLELGEERIGTVDPLRKMSLNFEEFDSVPDWERFESLGIDMNDAEVDTFIDEFGGYRDDDELHQIAGFPNNAQGDMMELEAQLVSNGIYCGDSTGYQSKEAQELNDGAKDWRLLLQLSSDNELDIMWGDCGRLYFWVREESARVGDFSNAWLVLQCS